MQKCYKMEAMLNIVNCVPILNRSIDIESLHHTFIDNFNISKRTF